MKNYEEKLIEMNKQFREDFLNCVNISSTEWEEDSKRFICGIYTIDEDDMYNSDYSDCEYGATIEDAVNNFYTLWENKLKKDLTK